MRSKFLSIMRWEISKINFILLSFLFIGCSYIILVLCFMLLGISGYLQIEWLLPLLNISERFSSFDFLFRIISVASLLICSSVASFREELPIASYVQYIVPCFVWYNWYCWQNWRRWPGLDVGLKGGLFLPDWTKSWQNSMLVKSCCAGD